MSEMEEALQPDISAVVDAIYWTVREWFPRSKKADCEELAFAIAHDTLHVRHVEAELWAVTLDSRIV
jgi:hypothetical protein